MVLAAQSHDLHTSHSGALMKGIMLAVDCCTSLLIVGELFWEYFNDSESSCTCHKGYSFERCAQPETHYDKLYYMQEKLFCLDSGVFLNTNVK